MDLDIQLKAEAKERDIERLIAQKDNNVLKFKKSKITFDGGSLNCEGKFGIVQFWPFKHGKKSYSIPFEEIQFVDVFPYGFFRKGVDITFGNDEELVLVSLLPKTLKHFVNNISSAGIKNKETESIELKQPRFAKKILRMEGDYLVFRKYQKRGRVIDYSKPEKVIYFDKGNSLLGGPSVDFGSLAGGGTDNSIFIDKITSHQVKEIRDLLIKHGSKLADMDNAQRYKAVFPLLNPSRWFSGREVLGFTNDGILHVKHTIGKSRSSYLPFESIKVISSNGLIFKRILIQGATTISTVEKFKSSVWKRIKQIVAQYGIKMDNIVTYRPVLYLFSRYTRGIKLSLSDEGVIYNFKKETNFLRYDQITTYEKVKPHWYSWFGDVVVSGVRRDARAGEGGDVTMTLPKIGPFRWKKIKKGIASKK